MDSHAYGDIARDVRGLALGRVNDENYGLATAGARFGASSERLAGQAKLFDAARKLPVPPEPNEVPVASHTRKGRPALPKDLPRTRIEYDLNDEQKAAFDSLERIGEERSETLHYEPSRLIVIEHIRVKCAAKKDGESTTVTANAQPSPLPKSNASANLLANRVDRLIERATCT